MHEASEEFTALVGAVVTRFFTQKGTAAPSEADVDRLAGRLLRLIAERGLPPPLPPGQNGTPGGMAEHECTALVSRITDTPGEGPFSDVARQLVKACFYPEFKVCRDSFREVATDGSCRRQELNRVRGRISGTHCVDCPHWVRLSPADHEKFLQTEWRNDPALLAGHRGTFLPEDFRALRVWLHAAARRR